MAGGGGGLCPKSPFLQAMFRIIDSKYLLLGLIYLMGVGRLQLYVQKVLCSDGPMFRRFYVQKVLCSEGSMFRRFYVQKVLYSEGSMLRRSYVQKYLFRRSYV